MSSTVLVSASTYPQHSAKGNVKNEVYQRVLGYFLFE